MSFAPRRLSDPKDLRAIAHPLRIAILERLTIGGPLTATELGDLLNESPANCSWHLHKLAEHGFVTEAEGGAGRQRPWRAAHLGMQWDNAAESMAAEPGSGEAESAAPNLPGSESSIVGKLLTRMLVEREIDRLWRALDRRSVEPTQWRDAGTVTQSMLWLTPEELAEINTAVKDLLLSKIERVEDPTLRPDGARLCAFLAWGVPAFDLTEES
ncbi:MAG: winged helix-turn-helix domain-containing protein [Nocardioidaceae bacterium]